MSRITRKHVGCRVVDADGDKGRVTRFIDNHNVVVRIRYYRNKKMVSGSGVYCLVKGCKDYSPLTLV